MTKLGVAITAAIVTVLVAEFLRHRKRALPAYGWVALAALLAAEWLMFRKVEPVATYFTPIAWTCWIFLADAAGRAISGSSRLARGPEAPARGHKASGHGARELGMVALLSIPLWLIFEAYNLRLENWTYVGLPQNFVARYLGYGWAFATITPAIFVTADLIESFGWFAKPAKPRTLSLASLRWMTVAGAVMLVAPLIVPMPAAAYLFVLVWVGFIFLLDPVNYRLRLPSLIGDLAEGRRGRLYSLLLSGWVCGWLWEFWNWWAAARWLYIFPMFQEIKIFEMPVPGYFGFPPFALECFTMYITAAWLVGGMKPAASRQAV